MSQRSDKIRTCNVASPFVKWKLFYIYIYIYIYDLEAYVYFSWLTHTHTHTHIYILLSSMYVCVYK